MQIIFESRDDQGNQLREVSIERARFAFRRLATWIPRVKVQFSDVNGPRGGLDKRCQVELNNGSAGKVVIVSMAQDWRTALDLSLRRAAQVLKRGLQRNNKVPRGRTARLALDS
ncbi:MAG: HPF/RaiA family ribosome-associated protein [Polaromonas sp.]|nr:HPF/RaiA family ribosome-associated protein [Polaromonas sp.]